MRIKNFKKFIKNISLLIIFISVVLIFTQTTSFSKQKIEYKEIYTSQGDTLWKIAKQEKEDNLYYKDKDVRDIIEDLKKINNLQKCDLVVSQKLQIPTL